MKDFLPSSSGRRIAALGGVFVGQKLLKALWVEGTKQILFLEA